MAAHAEDEKEKLCNAYDFAPSLSPEHLAGVDHGMDMHKPAFHLADNKSGVSHGRCQSQ